jgi:hypothetical protein
MWLSHRALVQHVDTHFPSPAPQKGEEEHLTKTNMNQLRGLQKSWQEGLTQKEQIKETLKPTCWSR